MEHIRIYSIHFSQGFSKGLPLSKLKEEGRWRNMGGEGGDNIEGGGGR